jgi:hypothetical protein
VKRAKRTEILLGSILGVMLLGLATLARRWHIGPRSGQTVLSQIMADAVGRHWAYYIVAVTITVVLALAANTSFGGLPILASLLSRDNYLPHRFALRGDRQVFSAGIVVLAVLAGALLIAVNGNTLTLIPLFAIGVFTGFTLAQAGLVVHWRRTRPRRWKAKAALNGTGAVVTGVTTVIFLVTKFTAGAWVVIVAVPAFMLFFVRIHSYYRRVARALGFGELPPQPRRRDSLVVVPINAVDRLAEHALSAAVSISDDVVAVVVVNDADGDPREREAELRDRWERWDPGMPLRVLHTDYASVAGPIVELIDELRAGFDGELVVLIPVVHPDRVRYRLLHNHLDFVLMSALRSRQDVVVTRVPMALHTAGGDGAEEHDGGRSARRASPSRRRSRR